MNKYVAYFRVSTTKQGQSGLGLEAQQDAVKQYADSIIHSFTEIESGKNDSRMSHKTEKATKKGTKKWNQDSTGQLFGG